MKKGLVIKNTGSWYLVRTDDGDDIECKVKGNFRLKGIRSTNPVAIGDRVTIVENAEGRALISDISDRKNYIIRRSSNLSKQSHIIASNIDLCFLLVTIASPETSTVFIDRFLASAEAYSVPVCLIFNKTDLYTDEEMEYLDSLMGLYTHIGYPCYKISALGGDGIAQLESLCVDKTVLLSGHSGVGKSTLINALIPDAHLRTAQISEVHDKGMHTTTFSSMIELPKGGFIIDTPGIKGFGTVDMEKEMIYHYFPDLFSFAKDCKYNNCIHMNEPGCAVIDAVQKHWISESRYKSYLSMMNEESDEKYRK